MREDLQKVQLLQDLANRIRQLTRDREMLYVDVRNRERVIEEKTRRLDQADEQRIKAIVEGDAIQLKIDGAEREIEKLETQLNVTKHQKEYNAILHSIQSRRADIQQWEDAELAALQHADDLREECRRLTDEVEQAEAERRCVDEEVEQQARQLAGRIGELKDEHDRRRREIKPSVLVAYERLAAANMREPLAIARNRICQGCFTQLTKQTELRLMRDNEIVYCHSCGRMLVLHE